MNAPIDVSSLYIETSRLLLRPFVEADLPDFYAYAKVPDVGEWAGWAHHGSIEESSRVVGSLGIEEYHCPLPKEYDALQGRELGYVLAKDKWGQGYMSEAVRAVIDYCFSTLNLDFLVCAHFARNERSKRVIQKAGFRLMGHDVYVTRYGTKEDDCYYVLDNPKRAL